MGRVRGYRSAWSCIALIALLGNVMASTFCCSPSLSRKTEVFDPILGAIPLCTSGLATLDNSGKKPIGQKQHCPVCLAAAYKALITNDFGTAFIRPAAIAVAAFRVNAPAVKERLRLGGLGSRAPPLPA
jgi:DUF2946 family protein